MGKVTGFLEYTRETARRAARQPSASTTGSKSTSRSRKKRSALQGARCMDCGVPFCHTGCPVTNIIPDWNDLVCRGRWREAIRVLHATNNFPEFTGRICPAPCEAACVLGINEPPSPSRTSRRPSSTAPGKKAGSFPSRPPSSTGKRVAVVGSGPAGLAAAQQLARAGHSVTVFEKADRIGGLLRYGIPNFKMEKHLIDRRIEQMRPKAWSSSSTRTSAATCRSSDLRRDFDAILLAGGAEQPRDLNVPGRELKGIHFAMDFLPQSNKVCEGDTVPDQILATGKRVVIIGGGDTGADCLGTSHRQQAAHITQFELLPKPPDDARARTRPGRSGPCSCASKARTKKAACATGASPPSASPATSTAT